MSDARSQKNDATVLGLPEVRTDKTKVLEDDSAAKATVVSPLPDLGSLLGSTASELPEIRTDPIRPIATEPVQAPPPRTRTGGIPRAKTAGATPKAQEPRRGTRGEVPAAAPEPPSPDPDALEQRRTLAPLGPVPEDDPFEWTLPRVAGLASAVGLLAILAWVFWPAKKPQRPPSPEPEPEVAVVEARPTPTRQPTTAPAPRPAPAPAKPTLTLDARQHTVDPYAAHAPDLPLDPAHKYRLRIERDDSRLGTVLARLEGKDGWGVMNKMASHAALQFGGARTLRLHCEPGAHFSEQQALPLELLDLATRKAQPLTVDPSKDCWDLSQAKALPLGEGVKVRVRVPTDAKLALGPNVPVRVAWVLEALGDKQDWRTGVLGPGESVLAEGRVARFALLDPYAGDNEGSLTLELLGGDTASTGLVTPSTGGAQFVPVK